MSSIKEPSSLVRIPTVIRDFLKVKAAQIALETGKKITIEKLVAKAVTTMYEEELTSVLKKRNKDSAKVKAKSKS